MDKSKVLVMLDNGHGSNCAGKRSPILSKEMQQKFGIDRFYEYKYVREIVAGIKAELEKLINDNNRVNMEHSKKV